jgi:hypothetical protein
MRISMDRWTLRFLTLGTAGALAGCGGDVVYVADSDVGAATGTATGSATSTGSGDNSRCKDPMPIVVAGEDTGYVKCANGAVHRPAIKACPVLPMPACTATNPMGNCHSDADCTLGPHGHCGNVNDEVCSCSYGCINDSDCHPNQICLCGEPMGSCQSFATCTSDASCSEGFCSSYSGCHVGGFGCETHADACEGDGDCPNGNQCMTMGPARACVDPSTCGFGRPFLVGGEARVASATDRSDWSSALTPRVEGLSDDERRVLADEWLRAGQLEHASIAAFARFAMHLLALGAPPDLVLSAQAAMADETAHARMCFALAGAYGRAPVGPGRLALDGSLSAIDEAAILRLAIEEGCIGETAAAIEAAELGEHAEDPVVRDVLARIAEDEARHAELAWSFVRWAIARDASLKDAARRAFSEVLGRELSEPMARVGASEERWLALGVAPARARAAIRRRVIAEVVEPVATRLFATERVRRRVTFAEAS